MCVFTLEIVYVCVCVLLLLFFTVLLWLDKEIFRSLIVCVEVLTSSLNKQGVLLSVTVEDSEYNIPFSVFQESVITVHPYLYFHPSVW